MNCLKYLFVNTLHENYNKDDYDDDDDDDDDNNNNNNNTSLITFKI